MTDPRRRRQSSAVAKENAGMKRESKGPEPILPPKQTSRFHFATGWLFLKLLQANCRTNFKRNQHKKNHFSELSPEAVLENLSSLAAEFNYEEDE